MDILRSILLILYGIFGVTMVSTLELEPELSTEDSVIDLTKNLRAMEIRLSRLEKKETSELESKNELFLKMQEVERKTLEHGDEMLGKAAGVEMRCMESTAHLLQKLQNLLEEQNEIRDELNSFLTLQRDNKDIIRKNLASTAEELRAYIDDRFTRFENAQLTLEDKIRTLDHSLLALKRELAILGVPESSRISRNLNRTEQQGTHTQGTCVGEPPSLQNGRARQFERSHGSTVQYECDPDFVVTGNSTVRCELGTWEGQAPTCVFFDRTFILECSPLVPNSVYCYSDENYRKIKLSRVLDTGLGAGLSHTSEHTDRGEHRFSFPDDNYAQRIGVFQCELNAEHGYMKIVTVIQRSKEIADTICEDPFRVVNIGDSVQLEVDLIQKLDVPVKWKHNGVDIPSWDGLVLVEILNVQTTDAGIYECFYPENRHEARHAIIRLIVRTCGENFYGKNCDKKCPPCYNGGICHDLLGICVCPAGFTGSNCEVACDGIHFGVNCSKESDSMTEGFLYFCKPDPYGCACTPGYTGFECLQKCDPGWYGADCKQPCHCANGPYSCNIFNGLCTGGCSTGWTGQSCQIPVAAQQIYYDDDHDDESDDDPLIWLFN